MEKMSFEAPIRWRVKKIPVLVKSEVPFPCFQKPTAVLRMRVGVRVRYWQLCW
jgi:hypothetical protein